MINNFKQYLKLNEETTSSVLSRAEAVINTFNTTMLYTWKNEYNKAIFSDVIAREKKVQLQHLIEEIEDENVPSLNLESLVTELEHTLNQLDAEFKKGKDVDDDYYLEVEEMISKIRGMNDRVEEFIILLRGVIMALESIDDKSIEVKNFKL